MKTEDRFTIFFYSIYFVCTEIIPILALTYGIKEQIVWMKNKKGAPSTSPSKSQKSHLQTSLQFNRDSKETLFTKEEGDEPGDVLNNEQNNLNFNMHPTSKPYLNTPSRDPKTIVELPGESGSQLEPGSRTLSCDSSEYNNRKMLKAIRADTEVIRATSSYGHDRSTGFEPGYQPTGLMNATPEQRPTLI